MQNIMHFELLRQAMAIKKRFLKNTNLFIEELNDIPFEEQVENYKAVCDKEIPKHNPKIIRLFRHTKIENAIKKIKEEEEAKELQDKVYAQLLADIEANEKGE